MPRLICADEAYTVLTDYYHHRTELQHKALKEALSRVPTVFSEVDLIEIEDRFGYFVRAIIEDMISGENNRWSTKWCEEMLDAERERQGHWVNHISENGATDGTYCSICDYEIDRDSRYNYCPNCGAEMDEVIDE